jgi:hypothetical protein
MSDTKITRLWLPWATLLVATACAVEPTSTIASAPIVGGQDAEPHEYRWMASLRNGLDQHFCGGTLIAPRWVLTSAFCVQGAWLGSVVIGGFDISVPSDGQRLGISRIIIHPGYNSSTAVNDIALIELTGAASAPTASVNDDAHFPRGFGMDQAFPPAQNATTIGWGDTEVLPQTTRLQEVEVPIVHNDSCNAEYSGGITSGMICAGLRDGGQGPCQHDHGGPLLSWSDSEPMVVGIASWSWGCAEPRKPGVYTRVSSYVPWIRAQGVPVIMKSDQRRASSAAELVGINNVANHESSRVQHLFELSPTSRLRHHYWFAGAWATEDLFPNAPDTHGPPAVVNHESAGNYGQPTQHVFARASNGKLLHYWWVNFLGWQLENLSNTTGFTQALATNPVAIDGPRFGNDGIASQHVFARGPNSTLLHFYWINYQSWRGENLSTLLSTPEELKPRGELAVVNAVNGVDPSGEQTRTQHVFARGLLDNLVHYWWLSTTNTWQVEDLTTGSRAAFRIVGDPVVINGSASGNDGVRSQHVFARASDGSLVHYYWVNYLGWAAENLTTNTAAGSGGLIAATGKMQALNGPIYGNSGVLSQHVIARSTTGRLIEYYWINYQGWRFRDVTTLTGGPGITAQPNVLLGTTISGGVADLNAFARGSNSALIWYRWSGITGWTAANLSTGPSPLPVQSNLVVLPGLERGTDGVDAMHVASKGSTAPVIYDWLDTAGWSSQLVN